MGLLKNKIAIVPDQSGFSSTYANFNITFEIIENSWPLILIVSAILAICGFLTVREVRLMKKPASDDSIISGFSKLSWPLAIGVAIVIALFIIPNLGE